MQFPKNILLTVTHAGYEMPQDFRARLSLEFGYNDYRLLKNFSDFATAQLVSQSIPKNQVIMAEFSRALGDPNRSLEADDLFRETDFNGNALWKKPLTRHIKEELLEEYYAVYHDIIQKKIDTGMIDILIDIHDTGNLLLAPLKENDTKREPAFPQICISNGNGETCDDSLLDSFAELLEKHTGLTVSKNAPFQGGYVTRTYGQQINAIQVEFGRFLYMDEATQEVDEQKVSELRNGLTKALVEFGDYV